MAGRTPQIVIGSLFALLGVTVVPIAYLATGEEPSKWVLGFAALPLILGFVVAWPGVMEGFSQQLADLVPMLGESGEDE